MSLNIAEKAPGSDLPSMLPHSLGGPKGGS